MELIEIKGLLEIESGAPSPIVVSVESKTAISFYKQIYDLLDDMPLERNIVYDQGVYSVIFDLSVYYKFGFPNDETLLGHPYYKLGLQSYGFYELKNSDLIKDLMKIDSSHRNYDKNSWSKYKHFILTFHDNMFECVARRFDIREEKSSSVHNQAISLLNEFNAKQF